MKANQKFANADEAVSPVIGVILMVAITVVLAAVVFVLVNNLTGETSSAPTVALDAVPNSETDTITLKHISGDEVIAGDLEISLQIVGAAPIYIDCTGAFGYEAGNQIIMTTTTDGAAACVLTASGGALNGGTDLADGETDYQVLVRHTGSGTTLLDTIVTVVGTP